MRINLVLIACIFTTGILSAGQKDPKKTPENTITVGLSEPVRLQTFPRTVKFYIAGVVDRSGNPQPILVWRPRGGIYLDREPKVVVQEALEQSLKAADALATDAQSADYVMNIYLFHFGLAEGSGMEFYGKVDLNVVLKNPKSGKSIEVTAMGTSIQGTAVRKKNILANVKVNLEMALQESIRNLLRGTKLRDAVNTLGET
jgi:hypothetical protein